MNFDDIKSDNVSYFNYILRCFSLDLNLDQMLQEFSGIYVTATTYKQDDLAFRVIGSYITRKGEKTKKKQLYNQSVKKALENKQQAAQIKKDFEKFVIVFNQLKLFKEIEDLEKSKKKTF